MLRVCLLLLVGGVGCRVQPVSAPTESLASDPVPVRLVATDHSFGGLTAKTPALLIPLRAALRDYDVVPVRPTANGAHLEYQVFSGSEQLLIIYPNPAAEIVTVQVTSPRVIVANYPWRVGEPINDASKLDRCDCWGNTAVCFHVGDHLAVVVERSCRAVDRVSALPGTTVKRLVWSPRPFPRRASAPADDEEPPSDDPCGP